MYNCLGRCRNVLALICHANDANYFVLLKAWALGRAQSVIRQQAQYCHAWNEQFIYYTTALQLTFGRVQLQKFSQGGGPNSFNLRSQPNIIKMENLLCTT